MKIERFVFEKALPVWKMGDQRVMNQNLHFSAVVPRKKGAELRISGASSYLVFINGKFVAHGPARTAHGYYKVDKISLDPFADGENINILISASGYNCNSFSYVDAPSFVCAEVVCGEEVLAATGADFSCRTVGSRLTKMPKYSYQRTFAEGYDFTGDRVSFDAELEV